MIMIFNKDTLDSMEQLFKRESKGYVRKAVSLAFIAKGYF
jgi:hypothetical protein